jgi:hypothetical protein
MKIALLRRFALVFASLMCVALLDSPVFAVTRVFLLGGQSNMAGVGGYSGYCYGSPDIWGQSPGDKPDAPCPTIYANQPTVKFWNYDTDNIATVPAYRSDLFPDLKIHNPGVGDDLINLQSGYGYTTEQFGPELSFGYRLRQLYPQDEIYLVKLGITSTSLAGDWNPTSGSLYNLFKQRVTAALNDLTSHGKTPKITGMIWMQGEEDATNATNAQNYASNLRSFVSNVRTAFTAPDMKFVVGRITTDVAKWAGTYQTGQVRDAQQYIANYIPNTSWVNTDDLEKAYYEHYGTQGQIDLGIRFANQFPGSPAPEPSTMAMLGIGLFGLLGYLWRKRK